MASSKEKFEMTQEVSWGRYGVVHLAQGIYTDWEATKFAFIICFNPWQRGQCVHAFLQLHVVGFVRVIVCICGSISIKLVHFISGCNDVM